MEPALLAVGAEHEPVGAVLLEQLDLVALVEVADLRAAQLVGRVEQAHDAVADDLPLAAVERADEALVEGQARSRLGVADRVGLAGLDERRASPARHQQLPCRRRRARRRTRPRCRRRCPPATAAPRHEPDAAGRRRGQDVVAFVFPAPAPEQARRPSRAATAPGRGHEGRPDGEPGEGRALEAGHRQEARQRAPAAPAVSLPGPPRRTGRAVRPGRARAAGADRADRRPP